MKNKSSLIYSFMALTVSLSLFRFFFGSSGASLTVIGGIERWIYLGLFLLSIIVGLLLIAFVYRKLFFLNNDILLTISCVLLTPSGLVIYNIINGIFSNYFFTESTSHITYIIISTFYLFGMILFLILPKESIKLIEQKITKLSLFTKHL